MSASFDIRVLYGVNGCVVAGSDLAAQAGIDVLENGGMSTDAAVASLCFGLSQPADLAVVVQPSGGTRLLVARSSAADQSSQLDFLQAVTVEYGVRSLYDLASYASAELSSGAMACVNQSAYDLDWRPVAWPNANTFTRIGPMDTSAQSGRSERSEGPDSVIAVDHTGMVTVFLAVPTNPADPGPRPSTAVELRLEALTKLELWIACTAEWNPLPAGVTHQLDAQDEGREPIAVYLRDYFGNGSEPFNGAVAVDKTEGVLIACANPKFGFGAAVY